MGIEIYQFDILVQLYELEREGYTFSGWYSDVELIYMYTMTTMPAENIVLYARWIEN